LRYTRTQIDIKLYTSLSNEANVEVSKTEGGEEVGGIYIA